MVKRLPTVRETQVRSLDWKDPLEKKMITHSSILAWKERLEPGRLQSMGSQRVGHDRVTSLSFTFFLSDPVQVGFWSFSCDFLFLLLLFFFVYIHLLRVHSTETNPPHPWGQPQITKFQCLWRFLPSGEASPALSPGSFCFLLRMRNNTP